MNVHGDGGTWTWNRSHHFSPNDPQQKQECLEKHLDGEQEHSFPRLVGLARLLLGGAWLQTGRVREGGQPAVPARGAPERELRPLFFQAAGETCAVGWRVVWKGTTFILRRFCSLLSEGSRSNTTRLRVLHLPDHSTHLKHTLSHTPLV